MEVHDTLSVDSILSRRDFNKWLLLSAATSTLIQACATFNPKIDFSKKSEQFNIRAFNSWFKSEHLYTGINKNISSPDSGGHYSTFENSIHSLGLDNKATPGTDYNIGGRAMVAAAPGVVTGIELLKTGRLGGFMVTVSHPINSYREGNVMRWGNFKTYYAHLDNYVLVDWGQKLERGTPIGTTTTYSNCAKMMFQEGNNWTNPDRYGPGMGYMVYSKDFDSSNDPAIKDLTDIELKDYNKHVIELVGKQNVMITRIEERKKDYGEVFVSDNYHIKRGRRQTRWSTPEQFFYLEKLYEVNPGYFPSLSKEKFNRIRSEFYKNQPIILTLPFIKN